MDEGEGMREREGEKGPREGERDGEKGQRKGRVSERWGTGR